jgi:hypothetical protein
MDDAVRLSAEAFRNVYEASFKLWFTLHRNAIESPGLPASYLAVHNAFRSHPAFPRDLKLKSAKYEKRTRVYATGSSAWVSAPSDCDHPLPSFHLPLKIEVGLSDPISVSIIVESPERGSNMASWFDRKDQNYVSVLILAWAYILSTKWAEVMPESCSLTYTDRRAGDHPDGKTTKQQRTQQPLTALMIGDAGLEEARWWAAILAPDQGWQASMAFGQDTVLLSPWSVKLESGPCFILSPRPDPSISPQPQPPSFREALRFLDNFCIRHGIVDQSHAALATVLLFPSMGTGRRALKLPALTMNGGQLFSTNDAVLSSPLSSRQFNPASHDLRHNWAYDDTHLNRLIILSCNTAAMRPMLLSVFYDPSIECNAVTPWLRAHLQLSICWRRTNPLCSRACSWIE